MNAMVEPQAFQLPKKPRIKQKDAPPDQRKVAVVPIRALSDKALGDATVRALALLCSYCNRAGITWVGQKKLALDAGMSQQAISKHIAKLVETGYVEVIRKGFRGERANTWRVIFDKSVDADTAMSVTSAIEDTRPPVIRKEQQIEAEKPDPEGQRRIAQMLARALKQPSKKEYTMPKKGDTRAVREVKEAMAKAAKKHQKKNAPFTTSEVVHESTHQVVNEHHESSHNTLQNEPPYTTSYTTSEVVQTQKNTGIYITFVLHNQQRIELKKAGLSD
ncbi:MAG: ArsR/SmtB family transcription factor, partial [Candidatus Fonsibacter ubiquis]